ncbi:MAG: helix-turn-helix transcriptional regulator, partial [Paracoccaceae bacterium]
MKDGIVIIGILIVQIIIAVFFVSDILAGIFGVRTQPISWRAREMLEIGAAVGLVLGSVLGAIALRKSLRRQKHVESQLRLASGAFMELLEEKFQAWGLTPSERDVALFAIKGMSTTEIAELRKTSEGTVKAQTNAIYRKADVSGRPQLLSLFIDDLMGEGLGADAKGR